MNKRWLIIFSYTVFQWRKRVIVLVLVLVHDVVIVALAVVKLMFVVGM